MERRAKRRRFGPLLYSTLVAAAAAFAFVGLEHAGRAFREWRGRLAVDQLLRSPSPTDRQRAVRDVATSEPDVAVPKLLGLALDPAAPARSAAIEALAGIPASGEWTLPALLSAANDADAEARRAAARAFGRLARSSSGASGGGAGTHAKVVSALTRLARDLAPSVRLAAAESLGRYGPDETAAEALRVSLRDPDRPACLAASRTLLAWSSGSDAAAVRALVPIAASPEPEPLRRDAIEALKPAGAAALAPVADAIATMILHDDPLLFDELVGCLPALGPAARAALPGLERLLDNEDPDVRASAAFAISGIEGEGSPGAIAALIRVVIDPSMAFERRLEALQAIQAVVPSESGKAAEGLIRLLASPSQRVRLEAAELLLLVVDLVPAEQPGPDRPASP